MIQNYVFIVSSLLITFAFIAWITAAYYLTAWRFSRWSGRSSTIPERELRIRWLAGIIAGALSILAAIIIKAIYLSIA